MTVSWVSPAVVALCQLGCSYMKVYCCGGPRLAYSHGWCWVHPWGSQLQHWLLASSLPVEGICLVTSPPRCRDTALQSGSGPRGHADPAPFCCMEMWGLSLLIHTSCAWTRSFGISHSLLYAHLVIFKIPPQWLDTQNFHSAKRSKDTNKDVNTENRLQSTETNEDRKLQPLTQ